MNAGRPRSSRRLRGAAALAVIVWGAAACAIPLDDEAHITAPEDVPFQLLEEDPGPAAPVVPIESALDSFDAYFVRNQTLVPVRTVIAAPAGPSEVLAALLEGPDTDTVTRSGLRSALTDASLVLSSRLASGVVTIDLAGQFSDLASREQLLALGQMVMTVTSLRGVGGVEFEVKGEPTEIPIADGTLTRRVSRDSYEQLLDGSAGSDSTSTSTTTMPSTTKLSGATTTSNQ